MIHSVNQIAEVWFRYMASAALQATLLALFILGLIRIGRLWSPALRHALMMLALCKFVVPPMLTLPTGLFNHIQPQLWSQSTPAMQDILVPGEMEVKKAKTASGSAQALRDQSIPKPILTDKGALLLLHFTGALLILSLVVAQRLYLRRLSCRATAAQDPALVEAYSSLCRDLKLWRMPQLFISRDFRTPITYGVLKPMVVLPETFISELSLPEIRVILGHELAHHRRRDPWLAWLQVGTTTLWWFNPIYWLLSRSIRAVREDCCDDMVLASGLASHEDYCRTLLQAARVARGRSAITQATFAYLGTQQPLRRRFKRIMNSGLTAAPKLALRGMLTIVALGLVLLPGVESRILAGKAARAEESKESPISTPLQKVSVPPYSLPDYYQKWLEEDVVYIITDQEKAVFISLKTDEERDIFVEEFWKRRNPDPESNSNKFKEEHYRRIEYSNQNYASTVPGWKTDRGMIYIKYGKPDEIESHPSFYAAFDRKSWDSVTTAAYPFERWWYRHMGSVGDDIEIEFVDTCLCNEYHIAQNGDEKADMVEAVVTHANTGTLPYDVKIYYPVESTKNALVFIYIELNNKDLDFIKEQGINRAKTNVYGIATDLNGRIMAEFEDSTMNEQPEQVDKSELWQYRKMIALPVAQQYKLELVVKDIHNGKTGTCSLILNVPAKL